MIYATIWVLCAVLVVGFFWEVLRAYALPILGAVAVAIIGAALVWYWLGVWHAFLCANPWAVDAAVWAIAPVCVAVLWATRRAQRGAAH